MAESLIVEDEHFSYLKIQKGSLDKLSHDRVAWQAAYEEALTRDFGSIRSYLPTKCNSVLDIGGGLGGIDVLLARKYGCGICILDGEADAPVMELHRKTFNHMGVARDFLTKNGVGGFDYLTPEQMTPRPFDLIISLGSWCFHYPPSTYLDFVVSCCHSETMLVVDVRKQKPDWLKQLQELFTPRAVVHHSSKFDRWIFRCD